MAKLIIDFNKIQTVDDLKAVLMAEVVCYRHGGGIYGLIRNTQMVYDDGRSPEDAIEAVRHLCK